MTKSDETTLGKDSKVTIGLMVLILAGVVSVATAGITAWDAKNKTIILDQSVNVLKEKQILTKAILDQTKLTSKENRELLKKLSDIQHQQQLILNTQKFELRFIKEGIKTMLKKGS